MRRFLDSNPDLRSRFTRSIDFADYFGFELAAIYRGLVAASGFHPTQEAGEGRPGDALAGSHGGGPDDDRGGRRRRCRVPGSDGMSKLAAAQGLFHRLADAVLAAWRQDRVFRVAVIGMGITMAVLLVRFGVSRQDRVLPPLDSSSAGMSALLNPAERSAALPAQGPAGPVPKRAADRGDLRDPGRRGSDPDRRSRGSAVRCRDRRPGPARPARIHVDLTLLGACAIEALAGWPPSTSTKPNPSAVAERRAAMTSDRLGTAAPFQIPDASLLTHLVVEADAPEAELAPLRAAGVALHRGGPPRTAP